MYVCMVKKSIRINGGTDVSGRSSKLTDRTAFARLTRGSYATLGSRHRGDFNTGLRLLPADVSHETELSFEMVMRVISFSHSVPLLLS